ncbi:hypothetical protein [Paenibacillus arenilitoris]|uniref:Uncharacterized protein n=1 Tax=Paenibacillus arenilitoris TaxID=2772299 RepID=A0A927H6A1_9BACL|nr:hypothetical protein [Paenibacillus arenilitoris]MBD2870331.1 hypothetical protein [Paenibacillus arenilitoris]
MGFRKLFAKELRSVLPLAVVFAVAIVLLHFFVLYKSPVWDDDFIMVMSLFLPFLLTAVLAVGAGYYQLHIEWKTNSIYLLLALPIRGWKVMTAKLAAVLTMFVCSVLWIAISFALILLRSKWDEVSAAEDMTELVPAMLNLALHTFWMYALAVLFLLAVVQFAFLCGQLVARFKGVVVLAAFLGALWLVLRVTPLLSQLLGWMPDIFYGGASDADAEFLHAGPFVVLFLISIGFIWLSGYIFEKEVEV